jgi:hypothetical protein
MLSSIILNAAIISIEGVTPLSLVMARAYILGINTQWQSFLKTGTIELWGI